MICPAYQSAFIYDKDELRKKFSYFQDDTVPKVLTASKTKYLIAEATPYRKKIRSLQTVPVKKVMVAVPDSISGQNQDSVITADLDKAARSIIDSTVFVTEPRPDSVQAEEDSTYFITKDREVRVLRYNMPDSLEYDSLNNKYVAQKPAYYVDEVGFNTEQDNYMWYLRHSLILPDVRLAKGQQGKGEGKEGKKAKKKKGTSGFFKGLFKKKKTEDIDSAELEIDPNQPEQFDFVDTTAQEEPVRQQARQKKGFLKNNKNEEEVTPDATPPLENPKKKKKKAGKKALPKVDKKKEEDADDGF